MYGRKSGMRLFSCTRATALVERGTRYSVPRGRNFTVFLGEGGGDC